MEKDLTLLVLAAGMGSRYGGLKQIEPVGPSGEFIIDYSIYDAIKAGFTKVVFVIKKENEEAFRETIGKRLEGKIKIEYAFQDNSDVPEGINIPEERVKPLGTAHAIYSARKYLTENFATINADDYYGIEGYFEAANFLKNCGDLEYANVCYEVGKTLTTHGAVKRGVAYMDEDGKLEKMIEAAVEQEGDRVKAEPVWGGDTFYIELNHPVSMNLFCLTPKILEYISNNIKEFFSDSNTDLLKDEYLLPVIVNKSAHLNGEKVRIIPTTSNYLGMTYKEDTPLLKEGILKEIEKGNYKEDLWS